MIPAVSNTVRAYTRRFLIGDSAGWRAAPLTLVVSISAVLLVVPSSAGESSLPLFPAVFGFVGGLNGAYREYRFGGPPRLILVAALTTGGIASLLLVPVVAIRGAIGGPALPFLDVLVVLGTFGLLVAYLGGWWKPEAAFETEVRAERARRGIDAVASGLAGSDTGRGLWAYFFAIALGCFGLLVTAFIWTKNADWLTVALGVGINGSFAAFGLVAIVRARRASRR
jgi:hypothetical protein